jgi:hypothetical protein
VRYPIVNDRRSKRLAQDSAQRAASNRSIANWIFQSTGSSVPTAGYASSQLTALN